MHVLHFLRDDRLDPLFVIRIDEGKQQRDRHRFDPLKPQLAAGLAHGGLVERLVDAAVVEDALGHGEAPAARNDLLGRGKADVPDVFLEAAAVFKLVAETLGGDQPGQRTVHFDQRVVGDGGAVDDGVA